MAPTTTQDVGKLTVSRSIIPVANLRRSILSPFRASSPAVTPDHVFVGCGRVAHGRLCGESRKFFVCVRWRRMLAWQAYLGTPSPAVRPTALRAIARGVPMAGEGSTCAPWLLGSVDGGVQKRTGKSVRAPQSEVARLFQAFTP